MKRREGKEGREEEEKGGRRGKKGSEGGVREKGAAVLKPRQQHLTSTSHRCLPKAEASLPTIITPNPHPPGAD